MNDDLRKLGRSLGGGNYSVFLRAYSVTHSFDAEPVEIIRGAIGPKAILDNIRTENTAELMPDIQECLEYTGDDSHGPWPRRLSSNKFKLLCERVLEQVRELSESSRESYCFSLKEGHPAYPVFWEFAYLFRGTASSTVFIGSSSD
jgi:hypothetical protein